MPKSQLVSPLTTGGAGHLFEYRIAAIMLAHLLSQSPPVGLQKPVVRVGLQQRALGYVLDDIVVDAEEGQLCTQFQVKRTLGVTPSDLEFLDVVSQALEVLRDEADAVTRGEVDLGLIAEGDATALGELQSLTEEWAQQHAQHDTFGRVFAPRVVRQELRSRLEHVERTVEKAIANGAPDLGGVARTTHALLSVLHVWCASVRDDGSDYRDVLKQLEPIADEYENTSAVDLFAHIEALARGSGPAAGVVDAGWVRRKLHRRGLTKKSGEGSEAPEKIVAEAVVSGPFEALGLQHKVEEADALLNKGDPRAIEAFDEIAEQLQGTPYRPHATSMLRKRASALQTAGHDDEATIARVGLVWDELDQVRPWEASFALHDGMRPGVQLSISPATERVRTAAEAAVWAAKGGELDTVALAFDTLTPDDPYRDRAAVFLVEEAIAADRPEMVLDRLDALTSIADGAAKSTEELTRRCAVRLRMCLADATDEWTDLLRKARRDPWPILAWVQARYARYLALSGDGAGAQEHYLDAIEHASAKELFDEAADWLYALRTVRSMYEQFPIDKEHPIAQALRPYAKPSTLPGSPHTAELALQAMLDDKQAAEALQRVERWRWQAVVRAQLPHELRALEALGTLQERQRDIDGAIKSYVRAGMYKKAAAAARKLPEQRAHIDLRLLKALSHSRAAAYTAVSEAADLLDDEEAKAWIDHAMDEITSRWTTTSNSEAFPWLQAFDVLASMGEVMSSNQADRTLELVDPLIERPANIVRRTDQATARILLSLASRRPQAIPMLGRAIVADQQMAEVILRRPDVLKAHRDAIAAQLAPFAADNHFACVAIVQSGADPAPATGLARMEVDQLLEPRQREPNSWSGYAGADDAAILASILDRDTRNRFALTMLDRVLDESELQYSRWNDLAGLFNICGHIDRQTQALVLSRVMEIARGQHDGAPVLEFDTNAELPALAIACAAKLHPNPAQCVEIEQVGMTYLRTASESAQWHVVQGLVLLPPEGSRLDLGQCAVHPVPALRTLAAIRWAKNPTVFSRKRAVELARDSDHRVRRALARALAEADTAITSETEEIVEVLHTDVRRSVRTLSWKLR
jgi:hypothetical protein